MKGRSSSMLQNTPTASPHCLSGRRPGQCLRNYPRLGASLPCPSATLVWVAVYENQSQFPTMAPGEGPAMLHLTWCQASGSFCRSKLRPLLSRPLRAAKHLRLHLCQKHPPVWIAKDSVTARPSPGGQGLHTALLRWPTSGEGQRHKGKKKPRLALFKLDCFSFLLWSPKRLEGIGRRLGKTALHSEYSTRTYSEVTRKPVLPKQL